MAFDKGQPKEFDLDSTDKLPILEGISIDDDVEDDSEPLEFSATMPGTSIVAPPPPDYRPSALDLPSLADSVRSVEERIARQNADYEALNRLYEKARDAQLAAGTRADMLASELGTAHSALAVEQHRVRELQAAVAETNAVAEQTRARAEEAMRESERAQSEARTLREALGSRDASIAQTLHSLGERDAQLFALQREHAKVVPALESRSQASARLERELKEANERAETLARDLQASRQSVAELTERISRAESEVKANRRDLAAAKLQAESYLEILRTRDWRGGFNQNMFREWDDKIAVEQSGRGALQAECERLKSMAAALNTKVTEQNETIEKLNAAKMGEAAAFAKKAQETQEIERARTELLAQIAEANGERKRVEAELAARAKDLAELRSQIGAETQRAKDAVAAAEAAAANLAVRIEELESESKTHEEEMTVLMAHLNEARRPIQGAQADFKRVSDELAQKIVSLEQVSEENRTLRTSLERTRGQLEERDLLIRRLERSASNNANVLGRLQTSIERLGGAPTAAPAGPPDYVAELVRIDCEQPIIFALGRRTRIGRAPGCELQIDSQSVSRNHAMILKSARELIVEDLNSTNGVLVNGRKVTRHLLTDGDTLTVGEIQFRCVLKFKASEGAADQALAGAQAAPTSVTNLSDLRPGDAPKGEPHA
jgi:predicted  nucleic acid-binding Zn-ribbon protein